MNKSREGSGKSRLTDMMRMERQIGEIRRELENPMTEGIDETEKRREIDELRSGILQIRKEMEAAGEQNPLCEIEKQNRSFEEKIPQIERMVLHIGGFFMGFEERTLKITDQGIWLFVEKSFAEKNVGEENGVFFMEKEPFLRKLQSLHLGEWEKEYSLGKYGVVVMDGTQWKLEIFLRGETRSRQVLGDNAYPWNFDEMTRLFGMNEEPDAKD